MDFADDAEQNPTDSTDGAGAAERSGEARQRRQAIIDQYAYEASLQGNYLEANIASVNADLFHYFADFRQLSDQVLARTEDPLDRFKIKAAMMLEINKTAKQITSVAELQLRLARHNQQDLDRQWNQVPSS